MIIMIYSISGMSFNLLQGSASTQLASMEKEKELLRIFLKVSQMENTILRRMNLSSFLMVSCHGSHCTLMIILLSNTVVNYFADSNTLSFLF